MDKPSSSTVPQDDRWAGGLHKHPAAESECATSGPPAERGATQDRHGSPI
jgi:hypothetical protein